jgi:molybdate transport system regulatory protein
MARLRVSIVFESGARIGPGKVKLLESIRDTGSISAAAREMGMSYKRAWLLLDSMNQAFTEPVVTAAPGGSGGGGATLTPFARSRSSCPPRSIRWERDLQPVSPDPAAMLADCRC